MLEFILYGIPAGEKERYEEVILTVTTDPARVVDMRARAIADGFHGLRVAEYTGEAMNMEMDVNVNTAGRLDRLAQERGIRVSIQASISPRRRWYSVGQWFDGRWHQVTGFTVAANAEKFIAQYGQ